MNQRHPSVCSVVLLALAFAAPKLASARDHVVHEAREVTFTMRGNVVAVLANLGDEANRDSSESSGTPRLKVVPLESATGADKNVLLAIGITIVVLGLIGLWMISKRGPKWVVLATAAGIWMIGLSLKGHNVREVALLSGSLSILGVAGVILGVIDLFSKPKKARRTGPGGAQSMRVDAQVVDAIEAEVIDADAIDGDSSVDRHGGDGRKDG